MVKAYHLMLHNSKQLQINSDSLRSQLPEVANIALDGVKIAGVAIEEVSKAFNIDGLNDISELMDDISVEVQNAFYQQGAFTMGQQKIWSKL